MSNTDAAVLSALKSVALLSDADAQRIADGGTVVNVPEGWALIFEGTPADKAYVIIDGTVSIRHGKEEIAQLGAGDVIGEVALVKHQLRTATVVSVTPLRVLHFTSEKFAELASAVPSFGAALQADADARSAE